MQTTIKQPAFPSDVNYFFDISPIASPDPDRDYRIARLQSSFDETRNAGEKSLVIHIELNPVTVSTLNLLLEELVTR